MDEFFQLIKASLWGDPPPAGLISEEVFIEMKKQALVALPASILSSLNMSDELKKAWKKAIYQHCFFQECYRNAQRQLKLNHPYVILKGTSAAQYYPNPKLRMLGDIDIMSNRKDYADICDTLLNQGYIEKTSEEGNLGRHRAFYKNGLEIEVHYFFALLNDSSKAEYFDNLIIENINSSHVLPDMINGLVLLEHIGQHLEMGLGLRQIIDWMMFVHCCLDDSDGRWEKFHGMACNIGLDKLAIVATRMCELYLGLSEHEWSKNIDDDICTRLMKYVLSCGNFGNKRKDGTNDIANLLTYARNSASIFRLLQERGSINWKGFKRYSLLQPFAWLYQAIRYAKKGLEQRMPLKTLKSEYLVAKNRRSLLDDLKVKQTSKGLAVYHDGKYTKEYKRP